uniref:G_PROTEIN_RECEP_F1_2 domain-containing protein n=1 Tax=Steinernema glaseri TaxID=37863 RepID=A0A1I8A0Q8_9BILA
MVQLRFYVVIFPDSDFNNKLRHAATNTLCRRAICYAIHARDMTSSYDYLYNRLLDVAAAIHCFVKITTILLILFATPQKMRPLSLHLLNGMLWNFAANIMRPLSLYLLNGMLWNFAANIVFAFMHIYPLFPELCFRIDGLASSAKTTITGQVLFVALIVCVLNCTSAHVAIFVYRYMIFAHAATVLKWRYRCRHILAMLHTVTAGITAVVYGACMTATAERKLRICFKTDGWQHPTAVMALHKTRISLAVVHVAASVTTGLLCAQSTTVTSFCIDGVAKLYICVKPDGWEKPTALIGLLLAMVVAALTICVFTTLLLRSFKQKKGIMSPRLLNRHSGILRVMFIITTVPIFLGALPTIILVICLMQPLIPNAKEIAMFSLTVIANYGSIYALVVIIAIKPYRKAAINILSCAPFFV